MFYSSRKIQFKFVLFFLFDLSYMKNNKYFLRDNYLKLNVLIKTKK
jgi:hypothetical protein